MYIVIQFRYEERYGSKDLPWNKWIIYIEGDENWNPDKSKWKKDKKSKWRKDRKKITFKSVFQTIVLSKAIKSGLTGIMKGKMALNHPILKIPFSVASVYSVVKKGSSPPEGQIKTD